MRVKKGKHAIKRRRKILSATKGYRHGRKNKEKEAKVAITKALVYAREHRRDKKNDFKRLWNIKIGAALAPHSLSYSKFMGAMKKKGAVLDRKSLATLAEHKPEAFSRLVANISAN